METKDVANFDLAANTPQFHRCLHSQEQENCKYASYRNSTKRQKYQKTTSYEYNARSQQTAVVDAINQRYEFVYDALGRRTQEKKGTATMSFVYDAVGNRSQRTDYNGAVTNYSYDALSRLTTISYPDATSATYGYDALSRLTTAANPSGTVTIAYDNRSRVASITDVFGQVVSYAYDANSNRTQLSLNGGTSASYQYDVINRLTQLTDNASLNTTFAYDPTNKLTARSLPNGVATSYQYDGLDRLTRLTHAKTGNTLADFQYQFNTVNNITQMSDVAGANNYTYDALDRLTAATHPNQTNESYTFDDVGNRTASHQGSSYSYQAFNRLVTSNSNTYAYNANGNLVSKTDASGSWSYSWDYENRLKQASKSGGVTVTYAYDALGQRIQRTSSTGGTEKFVYDGADILRDLDGSGATITDYLNGPGIDNKLRQTASGIVSYFATDHLGSTRTLTDALGNVVEQIDYDSFGNSSGSALTRYTYTGRERDPDTGMLYYRARFYDPQIGRFISEDPAGLVPGINAYVYVGNDPIQWTDPSGLCRCGLKRGPEYFLTGAWGGGSVNIGGGSVPGGTIFRWHAEFRNDAGYDPKCCEVRQLVSWNRGPLGPNTVPHAAVPAWVRPNTWIEDRNKFGFRYGRRTGPYSDLDPTIDWYHGNQYDALDKPRHNPNDAPGYTLSFRLIVVDVCQGGRRVYTSKTLKVIF